MFPSNLLKSLLENFVKFTGKYQPTTTTPLSTVYNLSLQPATPLLTACSSLQSTTLLRERPQHKCFSLNLLKNYFEERL